MDDKYFDDNATVKGPLVQTKVKGKEHITGLFVPATLSPPKWRAAN